MNPAPTTESNSAWNHRLERRRWLGRALIGAVAVALPAGGVTLTGTPHGILGECGELWFVCDDDEGQLSPHSFESDASGALWLEHDDGLLHQFAAEEWELEESGGRRLLWLWEEDDHWYAYAFDKFV